jgi:hypothetical protein
VAAAAGAGVADDSSRQRRILERVSGLGERC